MAWGYNRYGETDVPSGLTDVTAIAAGWYHSLAVKSDGTVVAWGWNAFGQTDVPTGLTDVTAVAAGDRHSVALRSDGTVVAWGDNSEGQNDVPTGLTDVIAIAAGGYFSLALRSDGTVVGWGQNVYGQTDVPAGLTDVTAVAAGYGHSLAVRSDGTVVAWGWNAFGQTDVPSGLTDVTGVAGGWAHGLALKSDGTVVAWRPNLMETQVPAGLTSVTAIAAGSGHNLAVRTDGSVVAWGANIWGETDVPAGLGPVIAVAAGWSHSLALVRHDIAADVAPPKMTVPEAVTAEATSTQGATVTFIATATDEVDGIVPVTCTPASGTAFPLGRTHVDCTATDRAGNVGRAGFDVSVVFPWSGILPPVNAEGTSIFKAGSTVPVKFMLVRASAGISNAVATLSFVKISDSIQGDVVEAVSTAMSSSGNNFRYADGQYIFNWSTKGLTKGTYTLAIDLGDGVVREVRVSLK